MLANATRFPTGVWPDDDHDRGRDPRVPGRSPPKGGERAQPNIEHGPVTLADLKGRSFAEVWQVAEILGYDRRIVRAGIVKGEIPATKVGREYRVPTAWLRQQAAGVAA
jgi:excisionase family DNA binding protein